MKMTHLVVAATCATLMSMPVLAEAARQQPAYTTADTSIGTLMADPRAKAILMKDMPQVAGNSRFMLAKGMTLRAIKPFSGGAITDQLLAQVDRDLARLRPAGR